jgi:twitching motility two-component system response regulator PilG
MSPSDRAAGMMHSKLAGLRVMVIDDSNTIRKSAEIFLKQAGCVVILAHNGFEALAKVADEQPDVILLDILMPRLDGYQTCALIRKNVTHRATPIIMLSSKDTMFDRAKGRLVGSDEHLAKPFTKEDLLNMVVAQLAPRSQRKPTSKTAEGVI